jgi:predicted RNase H-like HicB family nuclease
VEQTRRLTAIIEREDDGYVSFCPEVDVASQGATVEEARANLVEALTLFFETASPAEIKDRLHSELLITQVEVPVG